jgi:hypothetical protein
MNSMIQNFFFCELMDETLRLQFGTASNTIGTQWYKLQKYNETDVSFFLQDFLLVNTH